jgi:hypothetical protein
MTPRSLASQAIVLSVLTFLTLSVDASARSSYCSPSGDYCQGAFKERGRLILRFSTFSFAGASSSA